MAALAVHAADSTPPIELQRDDRAGQLRVLIDGREALVYHYGPEVDLTYYYPLRSPSGKPMTVLDAPHDPHHRSVWFADTVRLKGFRETSFYFAQRSRIDPKDPRSLFRDRVRHVKFTAEDATPKQAAIEEQLIWEADLGKTPVLDEFRKTRIVPLGKGEYLLDMKFEVRAAYGDVEFVSDQVHYAWPYVRMSRAFSVDKGRATMTNSEGGVNEKETHDKPARWVDYSNTVEGATEGLAMFNAPENGLPHRWLTRNYGAFGPRRAEARNGKPFTLKKGDSLKQRVGILVHSGDVATGRVEERYRQFTKPGE